MLPVVVHLREAGSYSSAESVALGLPPPATNTRPFPRRVALACSRAVPIGVARDQRPRIGS
jgi:hypothetical protein